MIVHQRRGRFERVSLWTWYVSPVIFAFIYLMHLQGGYFWIAFVYMFYYSLGWTGMQSLPEVWGVVDGTAFLIESGGTIHQTPLAGAKAKRWPDHWRIWQGKGYLPLPSTPEIDEYLSKPVERSPGAVAAGYSPAARRYVLTSMVWLLLPFVGALVLNQPLLLLAWLPLPWWQRKVLPGLTYYCLLEADRVWVVRPHRSPEPYELSAVQVEEMKGDLWRLVTGEGQELFIHKAHSKEFVRELRSRLGA